MNTSQTPPPLLAGRAIRCLAANWTHDVDNHTSGGSKVGVEEAEAMQWRAIRAHTHPAALDAVAFLIPQLRELLAEIDDIGTGLLCDCPLGCKHEQALEARVDDLLQRLVTGRLHTTESAALWAVGS